MAEHTHHITHGPTVIPASETAEQMAKASANLLDVLSPELRKQAELPFDEVERRRWHYVPREMFERKGVCFKEMNEKQRNAALNLMACGLSEEGYRKATAIMELETTLGEQERIEGNTRLARDAELYYFTVFGDPMGKGPWGWRAEGHHVSLHFTVINREVIAPYPFFFGSNPAEVRHGAKKGLRILSQEEDLARQILMALNTDQKNKAVINATAPRDIITRSEPKVEFGAAEGLAVESMMAGQRELMAKLIHEYIGRLPKELANVEDQKLRGAGLNAIHFAWAGAEQPNQPHYYRLHAPFFFVEYDNTQNNANHIHTVWRHIEDDFGMDLLRTHYRHGHA